MKRMGPHIYPAAVLTGAIFFLVCGCGSGVPETAEDTETIYLNLFDGRSAVTEDDKQEAFLSYLQNTIEQDFLESLPEVEDADVTLAYPEIVDLTDKTDEEILVNVRLTMPDGLSTYSADELAGALAKYVGNPSTDKITIFDSEEKILFPGKE